MKNDFYLGDLYPNLGYMTTRASTIPEPQDQTSLTNNDQDVAVKNPLNIGSHELKGHYFGLIIVIGVILLLGARG
jgi:hypothetical protein